jgi:thioredoxin reductase (NADPH)
MSRKNDEGQVDKMQCWDLIIVGAGPAGLATALWAGRLGLSALVLERADRPGGQLLLHRFPVVDYPGLPVTPPDALAEELAAGARRMGATLRFGCTVTAIEPVADPTGARWRVQGTAGPLLARDVVLATGLSPRRLGIPGEEALYAAGLVRRPSQELDWFRNRSVVVIGGGDRAVENALLVAPVAGSVTLVHRRPALRARPALATELPGAGVRLLLGLVVRQIEVTGQIARLRLSDGQELRAEAVCPYIGNSPNSGLLAGLLPLVDGEVQTDRWGATALPGLWAVGDLATPAPFQSLSRAVGDAMGTAKAILLSRRAP